MKYINNNKIYDTNKAEKVFEYVTGKIEVVLYVTSYNEWFYLCTERGHQDIRPLEPKYVKNILLNRNRKDLVDKYLGDK